MEIKVDMAYKSLNKNEEELCGDKVEILHTDNSHILILADGMGSGVKANILATMTSKILGTMFLRGILWRNALRRLRKPSLSAASGRWRTRPSASFRSMMTGPPIWWSLTIRAVFLSGTAKL